MTNGKRRAIDAKTDSRWQWRAQLADVLTLRDQGLLTQSEYQEKIEEVLLSLPEETRLEEHDPQEEERGSFCVKRLTGA